MPEPMLSMSEAASAASSESSTPESEQPIQSDSPPSEQPTSDTPSADPQAVAPTEVDPLSVLETLQLDETVKESLKKGYLRQSDYTKKTQEIADIRKQAEQYAQMQPIIEKVFNDPALYRAVLGITPNQEAPEAEIPDDPKAYAEWVINQSVEKMRAEFEAKDMQRQIEAKFDADVSAAEKLDPRLQDSEFGQIVAGLVSQNAEFVQGRVSAVDATKQAIEFFDAIVKKREQQAKNDLIKRGQHQRQLSTPSGSPATLGSSAPASMQDAFRMAQSELAS